MNSNNVVSLPVGASAIPAHSRVKLVSGLLVVATDGTFIGHTLQDAPASGVADVATKHGYGFHYAIASAAIANGAAIQGTTDGEIATGGSEGVALSAASGDGSIIRVIYY